MQATLFHLFAHHIFQPCDPAGCDLWGCPQRTQTRLESVDIGVDEEFPLAEAEEGDRSGTRASCAEEGVMFVCSDSRVGSLAQILVKDVGRVIFIVVGVSPLWFQ